MRLGRPLVAPNISHTDPNVDHTQRHIPGSRGFTAPPHTRWHRPAELTAMSEKEAEEQPRWLEVALIVLPPLTLITALLVYFAAVRQDAFAKGLGLNVDLLAEASTLSYLLRSTKVVFFPLAVAGIGLLLWLWTDRGLRRWARSRVHLQAISRACWALPGSAAALVLGVVLIAMVSPVAEPYVLVVWPFVLALAVLVAAWCRCCSSGGWTSLRKWWDTAGLSASSSNHSSTPTRCCSIVRRTCSSTPPRRLDRNCPAASTPHTGTGTGVYGWFSPMAIVTSSSVGTGEHAAARWLSCPW